MTEQDIIEQCLWLVEEWAAGPSDAKARVENGLYEMLREFVPDRFNAAFNAGVKRSR